MKIVIDKEQREFFRKEGYIEFESPVSEQDKSQFLSLFNEEIDRVIADRFKTAHIKKKSLSPEDYFFFGHNLSFDSDFIKKKVFNLRYCELAFQLTGKRPLRIAYEQVFSTEGFNPLNIATNTHEIYKNFLSSQKTLSDISCIQPIVCALMICLKNDSPEVQPSIKKTVPIPTSETPEKESLRLINEPTELSLLSPFPNEAGHILYFKPDLLLDLNELNLLPNRRYYLIAYTSQNAHYTYQLNDPHMHFLKQYGYVFNEPIKDKTHPIIYR